MTTEVKHSVFDKLDVIETQLINGEYYGDFSQVKEEVSKIDSILNVIKDGMQDIIDGKMDTNTIELATLVKNKVEKISERLY